MKAARIFSESTREVCNDSSPLPTEFVILGSGVSTAIPRISCIIRPAEGHYCRVCHDALENPNGPNRRCNVSALVRTGGRAVLIDCGKTIREAAMRHFPKLGVTKVDSIFLTHGHADALLGLDDSRDIQEAAVPITVDGRTTWSGPEPTPVFLNEETMSICKNVFPYLTPQQLPQRNMHGKKDIERRVAALSWNVYPDSDYFKPIRPHEDVDIQFTPFPMLHGGSYVCVGFLVKIREDPNSKEIIIAYLSDLHALPEETQSFLDDVPRLDILVIDLLKRTTVSRSHLNLEHAKEMVRRFKADRAVAVGMTCSLGMHDDVNMELSAMDAEGYNFRLAFDGMRLSF